MRTTALILALLLTACGSFQSLPGQKLIAPPVRVYGINYTVNIRMVSDWTNPWCGQPDAGDEINCQFSYEWFEKGGGFIMDVDSYRHLDLPAARNACSQAMALYTMGFQPLMGNDEIEQCAQGLLEYRFLVDGDRMGKDPEKQ